MADPKDDKKTEKVVTRATPVVETGVDPAETNAALTKTEQEDLLADAEENEDNRGGTIYYVLLDEFGQPTGQVQTEMPGPDVPYAPAIGVATLKPEVLSTPSGAPLTKNMNPAHTFTDPALQRRNPPPGTIHVGDKVVGVGKKETVQSAKNDGKAAA